MVCCEQRTQERMLAKPNCVAAPANSGSISATTKPSYELSGRGDYACRPNEKAIAPRSGVDPQPMAPLQGLKLKVLGDGDIACAEYQTANNLKASRGLTSHHLLRLPFGRFSFKITLDNDRFQWHTANALQLLIDFDNRHHNLEVFVLRDPDYTLKPQQLHFLNSRGERRVYISSVTRLNHDFEERLAFENQPIEEYGTATSSRRQGTVWIMVKRCNLQYSHFDHTPSPVVTTDIHTPNQAVLDSEGILSCIKLTGSNPRSIQRRMFKVVSSTPSASFVFHYRIPEAFDRIKSRDDDDEISTESVTKQEEDQQARPSTQGETWRTPDRRLPSGDTITLTPENTSRESEDDEPHDLTTLLDAIDTKQSELSALRQRHEELATSKAEELSALADQQIQLQMKSDADETTYLEEKSRLEAAVAAVKGRIMEASGHRKGKLQELRDELDSEGLTEKDLQDEVARLDVKVSRYKTTMQTVSANKRRKLSESK